MTQTSRTYISPRICSILAAFVLSTAAVRGQVITEFSLDKPGVGGAGPFAIVTGSDGNLWFTEFKVGLEGSPRPEPSRSFRF